MSADRFIKYLPYRIAKAAARLPGELLSQAYEIRLRLSGAASLSVKNRNVPFGENGVTDIGKAIKATKEEMENCLSLLCRGSLYAYEHTLKNGFVPIENGRAGVCGDAVTDRDGSVLSFREIYSIAIRAHGEVNASAAKLIAYYRQHGLCGTLIYSPPMLGKTTLLRSVCHMLSTGDGIRPYRVGIIDERREIISEDQARGLSDVISSCPKAKAMELLTRTMAPEVIACDELSAFESKAVSEAQNTGVSLIATVHAADREMLMRRGFIKEMTENGVFGIAVRIKPGFEYDIEKTR